MKATKFVRSIAVAAAAALTLGGLSAVVISPAHAAKSTVIVGDGVGWDSLNPSHPDHNSATNGDVNYLTNAGWWYYDATPTLKRNTDFGTYSITKGKTAFQMTFKVKPGRVWSDGTPIDAVDLLLSHVISSSAYSIKAGLGDPSSEAGSKFYSGGYGGTYDTSVVGNPVLSNNNMTLTINYSKYLPGWEITTPGAFPVHTLEALADGKKALQTAAANKSYKAKFLSDYTKAYAGDTAAQARMAKMGTIWTNDYNVGDASFNASSNPLLVVCSGAYQFKSYNKDTESVTLVLNPKYNAGPALPKTGKVTTIVYKYVADGTASVQALQNGDINIYQGMPGAAGYSTLKSLASSGKISLQGGTQGTFEHIDLRTGNGDGTTDDYTGPFASSKGQKAKDLRLAFFLAFPRYAALQTQLKPYNAKASLMNSNLTLPGSKYYAQAVKTSGITANKTVSIGGKSYTYNLNVTSDAMQERNTAVALKLVQKWYPEASATKAVIKLNMNRSGRQMRVENNALMASYLAKAGFEISNATTPSWSARLSENQFDVNMFAWTLTSVSQDGSNAQFLSDGSNNHTGWYDTTLDSILRQLEKKADDKTIGTLMGKADKLIFENAWTLPMYQWPQVTGYSKDLKGIKASPISPNFAWNYWEWRY